MRIIIDTRIIKKFLDNYLFLILAIIIAAFTIILNFHLVAPVGSADSKWYIAIAEGRIDEVIKPFSGRFLHPFLAGQLSSYFSINVNNSFLLIAIISLFFFFIINFFLLKRVFPLLSLFLIIPLFLSPYFAAIFREFFQPDIFYIFLTALFLLSLFYGKENFGLLIIFLLFLARESTIFLGVIMLAVALLRSKKKLFALTFFVMILSLLITYYISNLGLPNAHNLDNFTYILLKMPYNFVRNVLGIQPWVNTLSETCRPIFQFNLPQWLKPGSINSFGFCGFDINFPLNSIVSLLTIFGIMPTVLFFAIFRRFKFVINQAPMWLIVALVYGVGHYFISLITTTGVQRIMGYGWPAFLLATPFIIKEFFQIDRNSLIKISLIQLFIVWFPFVIGKVGAQAISSAILIIFISSAAHFYIFRLLKSQKQYNETVVIESK